ncbi:MAG TPA: rhomboid family intramembrane serine protease [Candidatus Tectomicrobia bacterium]|nr:rhomboid family intramembrane serine protease [Candidatus Tectomicrobia bacterium]
MIPLRDTIPAQRFPAVSVLLIALNVLAFFYELSLGAALDVFIMQYGAVPLRFILAGQMEEVSTAARFLPIFTSMFLHGGWLHLGGNMLYLWVFGDNVEDRLGHVLFLLFYLVCGLGAALTQIYIHPTSKIPMVGASGAVAGVLGAYLILFPHSHVFALIPILFFFQVVELPALLFLVFWFLMQFLNGAIAITAAPYMTGGVAWWAHIGGFVSGMALGFLLPKRKHTRGHYGRDR